MARIRTEITTEQYDLAVDVYRMNRSVKAIEKALGISFRAAKRMVFDGDLAKGQFSIQEIIEKEEQKKAIKPLLDNEQRLNHYLNRVDRWLLDQSDPEGISVKPKELALLLELARQYRKPEKVDLSLNFDFLN